MTAEYHSRRPRSGPGLGRRPARHRVRPAHL